MAVGLKALLIDPNSAARNRLKSVISNVAGFKGTIHCSALEEARLALKSSGSIDVVFVSDRIGFETVAAFVKSHKEVLETRDAAFVLLCESSVDRVTMTQIATRGLDAILMEPYSAQQFSEVIRLAQQIKQDRLAERFRRVGKVFVGELVSSLDQIARQLKAGRKSAISKGVFADVCSVVKDLPQDLQKLYLELAVEAFSAVDKPESTQVFSNTYNGVSERVRKQFAGKAVDALRGALAA